MQWNADTIKRLVTTIGFIPQNGKSGVYCKNYPAHSGYTIFVDFNNASIIYDSEENPQGIAIKVWEKTTSNFSQAENFVVLECVDRLLTKGYSPTCIELEKTYPSGRGHSGRLDILVKTADGVPFLMVECKTWGVEYEKEKGKMVKNGGQLFSYYSNDRDTQYLCLYTSRVETAAEYSHVIVDVEDAWHSLSGTKEIYDHWNKNFKDNGIFDSYAAPYDVKHKALTYGELKTLKEEDSGRIYNQIMEILRHNAISDKPNAFNKLLNLFVCKIIDEDKNPDDELEFQWLETDTDESLQLRLNDLYKEGMWRFLEIDVIDYKQDDVMQRLASLDSDTRQWVMEMYTNTRLKKSPNFAFVEVQDERTFALNAKVVREIVELLQVYKFRYAQKHEFLGNFFELLLNTSMKQEAGQYFTPVPITRFILFSLPLRELVQKRVDARLSEPLPAVIDYACGSGHFLTEYMSQVQAIIDSNVIDTHKASPNIQRQFLAWQGLIKFLWARDTVYGIDLDNRLVKTTKVSAFFNGDGEANVVWANGLDHFTKSETYRGRLARISGQDNGQFDILISNPPYSVEAFKGTVSFGEESFALYQYLTDNSSEIECLFVERMKQLVKVGGWAAVILPSSILTNSGIHAKAREILLKYFYVKAIVELGSGTFMETNTNTVILFLERRGNNDHKVIMREIDRFLATKTDVAVAGTENAFSTYVASVYEGLSFGDYVSLLNGVPNEAAREHELYADYLKAFGEGFLEKAVVTEKEKILYFLLTYKQDIVLVKAGKGTQEKKFLGYEFSKRRGHEGLHWLSGGTKLYDEDNLLNPQKANSYIYRAFLGEQVEIDESMAQNVSHGRLSGFIEYGTDKFNKVVNLGKQLKNFHRGQYQLVPLENICTIISGQSPEGQYYNDEGIGKPFYQGKTEFTQKYLGAPRKWTTSVTKLAEENDVVMSVRAPVGPVNIVQNQICIGRGLAALRCGPEILPVYLFHILHTMEADIAGRNGMSFASISQDEIAKIKILLPPLDVQQRIVDEVERLDAELARLDHEIIQHQNAIKESFNTLDRFDSVLLRQLAECNPPKAEIASLPDDTMVSFVEMASVSNDGYIENMVDRSLGDVRKGSYTYFAENDIIIAKITPCMENGKCALASGLTSGIGMGSSEFHVFRCNDSVLSHYLFGYLNREVIRVAAEKVMTGKSGHRRVPITFYQQLRIPLPPLEQQQIIVAEMERRKAEISRLRERLNTLKEEKGAILKRNL